MTTPRILPWHGTHEKMGLHIHAPSCMQSVCRTETDEQYTSFSMLPKIYRITAVRPAVRCLLRDPQHFINKQIFNLVGFNWLLKLDIQRQQCHVALCSCTWPWVTPSAGCLFKKTEKKNIIKVAALLAIKHPNVTSNDTIAEQFAPFSPSLFQ